MIITTLQLKDVQQIVTAGMVIFSDMFGASTFGMCSAVGRAS